jgi:glycosyltransferase involved in cell wall biosynthesis
MPQNDDVPTARWESVERNGNGHGHHVSALAQIDLAAPAASVRRRGDLTSVSIVVPAKNEARNLGWVMERIPGWVEEIVLVDGNSTDDTIAVAKAIRPDVTVVHDRRPGKGAALRAGFNAATGDIVVMLDADRSMDPTEIGRYTALVRSGYDLVKGSRFMAGADSTDITHVRNFGNSALRMLTNQLFGVRFSDLCYGYMAFRRTILSELALSADGFEIETQIVVNAVRAGLSVTEVPTLEHPRAHGVSNLRTFRDGQRVLRTLIALRLAPGPLRPSAATAMSGPEIGIELSA